MNKKIIIFICLSFSLMLVGCSNTSSAFGLKYDNNNIDAVTIEGNSVDDRYAYITGKVDNVEQRFIFDTYKQKVTVNKSESKDFFNPNKYKILDEDKGVIKIFDVTDDKEVFTIDMKSLTNISDVDGIYIKKEWSNTQRFLVLKQQKFESQTVIVDIANRKVIDIPLKGPYIVIWSNDDSKALIKQVKNQNWKDENIQSYIFDTTTNQLDQIQVHSSLNDYWTPDNKYLFYVEMGSNGISGIHKVIRYDIKQKMSEEVYVTNKTIDAENIRWISDKELICVGHAPNPTTDPYKMFSKPMNYYIIKYNIADKNESIQEIGPFNYIAWNYNHSYLYYICNGRFDRVKVNLK